MSSYRQRFSKRHGHSIQEREITIREDAPRELREYVLATAYAKGLSPSPLRSLLCRVLRKLPDRFNWSEYPNIASENEELIENCEWVFIYDIIEEIYKSKEIKFECPITRNLSSKLTDTMIIREDMLRVFINILNNAHYAVKEKHKMYHADNYSPQITVTSGIKDNMIFIDFTDNGNGIADGDRKKIFHLFLQPSQQGREQVWVCH